ncbi:hypothetical protein SLEP1_g11538 [Rubroshorea leprosula]|nr:hypothetical protein SLEP1_g11538 [Rubroshorea leprosula]
MLCDLSYVINDPASGGLNASTCRHVDKTGSFKCSLPVGGL